MRSSGALLLNMFVINHPDKSCSNCRRDNLAVDNRSSIEVSMVLLEVDCSHDYLTLRGLVSLHIHCRPCIHRSCNYNYSAACKHSAMSTLANDKSGKMTHWGLVGCDSIRSCNHFDYTDTYRKACYLYRELAEVWS